MTDLRLLELDGIGNVLLGLPLLLVPEFVSQFLGLPTASATFYPTILGAIFVGIGMALLMERFKPSWGGLGLGGAMSINMIFGIILAGWLLLSGINLSSQGTVILWLLVLILVGISVVEALSMRWQKGSTGQKNE
jgi:hypothetical protein